MLEQIRQESEDGQTTITPTEVVKQVFGEKSIFLQNLGLKPTKINASISMQRLEEIQRNYNNT